MIDIVVFVATATFIGFVAQVAFRFVEFLFKLRSASWDVDKLEKRIAVEDAVMSQVTGPLVMDLEAEAHGNVVYCFEVNTHQFVCQGTTVSELIKHMSYRYGNRKIAARIIRSTQEAQAVLIASGANLGEE